jgi:glycosyltransferase involved in cell wall biosynthesis
MVSFADPYIRDIYPVVARIFTDNKNVIDETVQKCGFDANKFSVHYMPAKLDVIPPKNIKNDGKLKILWASRVAFSKRPDLLKKIAEQLNPNHFQVEAWGLVEKDEYPSNYLKNVPNLTYHGGFNGVDSLPIDEYDIFLYTSQDDGLPNILLEITAKGLPIVASNAGGVSEFIQDGRTGYLVGDIENVDGYLSAIKKAGENPTESKKIAENAQALLKERHNMDNFIKSVKKDIKW